MRGIVAGATRIGSSLHATGEHIAPASAISAVTLNLSKYIHSQRTPTSRRVGLADKQHGQD
jgi:hypothetical protein